MASLRMHGRKEEPMDVVFNAAVRQVYAAGEGGASKSNTTGQTILVLYFGSKW